MADICVGDFNVTGYQTVQGAHNKGQTPPAQVKQAEKAQGNPSALPQDIYTPTPANRADGKTINAMKAALDESMNKMANLVTKLLHKQGTTWQNSMGNLGRTLATVTVDPQTKALAGRAIAPDNEWGAEVTAARIVDFAKGLTGGDPAKIEMMKAAVEKGFRQAATVWGGALPAICQETHALVMEGFTAWANA